MDSPRKKGVESRASANGSGALDSQICEEDRAWPAAKDCEFWTQAEVVGLLDPSHCGEPLSMQLGQVITILKAFCCVVGIV